MATAAALKKTVIFRLQKRQDEKKASRADKTIATSPPYIKSARNIKVSVTAICDLNFGIWTVILDPIPIVRQKSTRKLRSISLYGSQYSAASTQTAPPAITPAIYCFVNFSEFITVGWMLPIGEGRIG